MLEQWESFHNELLEKYKGELGWKGPERNQGITHLVRECAVVAKHEKLTAVAIDTISFMFLCPLCAVLVSADPDHNIYRRAVLRRPASSIRLAELIDQHAEDITVYLDENVFHMSNGCVGSNSAKELEVCLYVAPARRKLMRTRIRKRRNGHRRGSKHMKPLWSKKGLAKDHRIRSLCICEHCYEGLWQISVQEMGSDMDTFDEVFPLLPGAVLVNKLSKQFEDFVHMELSATIYTQETVLI